MHFVFLKSRSTSLVKVENISKEFSYDYLLTGILAICVTLISSSRTAAFWVYCSLYPEENGNYSIIKLL